MDATDGFRVSDLDDTVESQQAANIAEIVFHEHINDLFYNSLSEDIIQLESLADSTKPNYLKIPTGVANIHQSTIRYNVVTGATGESTLRWKKIDYLHPEDFLDRIGGRSTNETNTTTVQDFSGVTFVVRTKSAPEFCTSFDQEYVVFDGYDSDVDSVLQQSKNHVRATLQKTFTKSNTYQIDLPEYHHPTYMQAVKSRFREYTMGEALASDLRKSEKGMIKARMKQRVGSYKLQKKRYGR